MLAEFVDYYEVLEISPNANRDTIERIFRFFVQRYHPDNQETGDRQRFDIIMEAHQTLADPARRAQYDLQHGNRTIARAKFVDELRDGIRIDDGVELQNKLLSTLWLRCKQSVREPGVGDVELEHLLGCPIEHLEFHLWYLKEKGWIRKTENGLFAITVEGVDQATFQHHGHYVGNSLLTDQTEFANRTRAG
ncbi:J domain-containing protein [Bradyrhizobium jicamae]|uniref:J domain-containing protein n=1 Tax=Bradyrhizobium jicamae TaxID=280332 RepID=A0ABS5FFV7_9BRAD|nr:J domain-containing protein [Bradyrhizobium jicamae]MBR0795256.1 J domain-containing protein [Bradyrhizobium jicamae]MBR0931760.1 J domain-containing protein [Bradyrhizobium jicamae]